MDASGHGAPAGAPASQFGAHGAIGSSVVPSNPVGLLALVAPVAAPLPAMAAQGNPVSGLGSGPVVNVNAPIHSAPSSTTGSSVNANVPVDSPPAG